MAKRTFYYYSPTYKEIPSELQKKIESVMELTSSAIAEFDLYCAFFDEHSFVLELWRVTERHGSRGNYTEYFCSVGYDDRAQIPYECFERSVQGVNENDLHLYVFGQFKTFTGALKSLLNHGNYTINKRVPLKVY